MFTPESQGFLQPNHVAARCVILVLVEPMQNLEHLEGTAMEHGGVGTGSKGSY